MYEAIANMKLSDVLQARPAGEPVNVHVVTVAPEPKDDFAAMNEIITGDRTRAPNTAGQPVQVELKTGA